MATFKAEVQHQKADGKYNVKIRVTLNRKKAYNSTNIYVTRKQLYKDLSFKDPLIIDQTNDLLKTYYAQSHKMGDEVNLYSARELADILELRISKMSDDKIDFIVFSKAYIEKLKKAGQGSYAQKFTRAVNNMVDFFGTDKVMITEIAKKKLIDLIEFLQSPREYVRKNQFGNDVTYHTDGSKNGVIDTIGTINKLFNEAKKEYNDEDSNEIRITHSPFANLDVRHILKEIEKRCLTLDQLLKLRDYVEVRPGSRMELGRDVFMLSFYLVGMNTADIFNVTDIKEGRLEYKRAKTKSRRKDQAFISIKIEPEVQLLIDKYRDPKNKRVFRFYQMYTLSTGFNKMLNAGLQNLALNIGLEDLTSYYTRHTWGTIARNDCRVPMDDIAMAFNHVNAAHKVTDRYVKKSWTIIDEANRKVLDFVNQQAKKVVDNGTPDFNNLL